MSERRQNLRQKSFLRGRMNSPDGSFSYDCMIRDLSKKGARTIFADPTIIPDVFDLHIPKENRTMRALVTWRHGDDIGVAFSNADQAGSPSSTNRDLADRVMRLESEIVVLRQLLKRMMNKANAR